MRRGESHNLGKVFLPISVVCSGWLFVGKGKTCYACGALATILGAHVSSADRRRCVCGVQSGEFEVVLSEDNLPEGVVVQEDVDGSSVCDLSGVVVFRLHAAGSGILVGPQAAVQGRLPHG